MKPKLQLPSLLHLSHSVHRHHIHPVRPTTTSHVKHTQVHPAAFFSSSSSASSPSTPAQDDSDRTTTIPPHAPSGPCLTEDGGARTTTKAMGLVSGKKGALPKPHQMPARRTLDEKTLVEKFIRGTGPGGQKINKSSIVVQLTHVPSSLTVKCQATRSREQNRKLARLALAEKLDLLDNGAGSRLALKAERKRRAKSSKTKKARRKYRALDAERGLADADTDADTDAAPEMEMERDGVPENADGAEDKAPSEAGSASGPADARRTGDSGGAVAHDRDIRTGSRSVR